VGQQIIPLIASTLPYLSIPKRC